MNYAEKMRLFLIIFAFLPAIASMADGPVLFSEVVPVKSDARSEITEKAKEAEKLKDKKEAAEEEKRIAAEKEKAKQKAAKREKVRVEIEKINLPDDQSQRFNIDNITISGNTLIATEELLQNLPLIFNVSDKTLAKAESSSLYDFRILYDIISEPGKSRQLSARSIQGFTRYILSMYQKKGYAGIYVYVPSQAIEGGIEQLKGTLPIEVLEAPVSLTDIKYYDVENNEREKGFLKESIVREWSPVKDGQVANSKKLDDFINLLNLNPDRYVSAKVSKGADPKSLAVGYDIYEVKPCHYYIQIDNSGTDDRQWSPRVGYINTNLTGTDDRLTLMGQLPLDEDPEDNHSIFGSYDFPLGSPRLRLSVYAGRSEFDTDGGSGIRFLGNGKFIGSVLRYNAFQQGGWHFDVLGSLSREESKITTTLFPSLLGTDVDMDMWSVGVDIHKSDDMSRTSFIFNRSQRMSSSDQAEFDKARPPSGSISNDFRIYTYMLSHSQFLDLDKIQRVSGTFRAITSNTRLVPAKMTTFGGMYTVRGYAVDKMVADGGILASVQYEFDIVKHAEAAEGESNSNSKPWLRKLAPLVFVDYGRAKIRKATGTEKGVDELCSIGLGAIVELGDHFNGAVYYGHPLRGAGTTRRNDGRVNVSLILRW